MMTLVCSLGLKSRTRTQLRIPFSRPEGIGFRELSLYFCYQRHLCCTDAIYCHQLLRIARMKMKKLEKKVEFFQAVKPSRKKNRQNLT